MDNGETGIVVKWFFNRIPVYQWIQGEKPGELGILRDRLNLNYIASDQDWAAHRALYINNPTTELTGLWTCKVSTFETEAIQTASMIVFAPQKDMDIVLVSRPTPDSINISCWANGVFPEPKLTITYGSYSLPDLITDSTWNDGAYDVMVHKIIEDSELSLAVPVVLVCELKIPNTSYIIHRKLLYGGPNKSIDESSTGVGSRMLTTIGIYFYTNIFIVWILFGWT